jgi:hypothetical protein
MSSLIEIFIKIDDSTSITIRRPFEVSTDTNVFHGTKEKTSNFNEVFQQIIEEVKSLVE